MTTADYFSDHYRQARRRFIDAAAAAGAALYPLALDAWDPQGEALGIDIAWLGRARPRRAVLHISGVHGVEGFAGSAIQLKTLAEGPAPGPDSALILVHSLNPYGMAWLRRTNEANVDLNRNFPAPGQRWAGAPALYHALNPVLNPASPPAWDGFPLQLLPSVLRYGLMTVVGAVAAGQYDYPQGLFYGGQALQPGPRRFLSWLGEHLGTAVEILLAIDVHTGLGPRPLESLYLERQAEAELRALLGERRFVALPYAPQGSLNAALAGALPQVRVVAVAQELGTYSMLRVLSALRQENRWHHYGRGGLDHSSKRRLREMFCPRAPAWRAAVLEQGYSLLAQAVTALKGRFTGP